MQLLISSTTVLFVRIHGMARALFVPALSLVETFFLAFRHLVEHEKDPVRDENMIFRHTHTKLLCLFAQPSGGVERKARAHTHTQCSLRLAKIFVNYFPF